MNSRTYPVGNKIELLALDIGGVLASIDKEPIKNVLQASTINEFEFFDEEFWQMQRGVLCPKIFLQKKSAQCGLKAFCLMEAFCKMIKVKGANRVLPRIKIPYIFVSNINDLHFEVFCQQATVSNTAKKFSLLSYKIRRLKPCRLFFLQLTQVNPCRANKIFFIDDKMENLKVASQLGIKIAQCHSPNRLESILDAHKLLM